MQLLLNQLTFSCQFDLSEFPFDTHECPMEIYDRIYDSSKLYFKSLNIIFGNFTQKCNDPPIIIDHYPFPFTFYLQAGF